MSDRARLIISTAAFALCLLGSMAAAILVPG